MLVRAHKRAVTEGGELRLVITWQMTEHAPVLAVTEIDRLMPSFSSLGEALAETPVVAIRPQHPSLSTATRGAAERRAAKVAVKLTGTRDP